MLRKLAGLRRPLRPIGQRLIAIIDIGSNSVRLVVYRGLVRDPPILFNEKVLCGLGRSVGSTGKMDQAATEAAIATLSRFALLCADMDVDHLEAVATSAVREARNGQQFLDAVSARCGFDVRVIDGIEEARLAALGVLSGMPGASGVVGDLGGGSLELIGIGEGRLGDRISLPIGPLNLLARGQGAAEAMDKIARAAVAAVDWLPGAGGEAFYMVGGSWRAIAHLHMHLHAHPLPIIHNYVIPAADLDSLVGAVAGLDKKTARSIPNLAERRLATLLPAALVLRAVIARTGHALLVNSSHGLREGLLYEYLPLSTRAEDPFIEACRAEARIEGRFEEHGDVLMQWIDPLFADDSPEERRLRHAACLLADVSWRGHPDFRARRAVDVSLFGNWVGVDARGRAMVSTALMVCYGTSVQSELGAVPRRLLGPQELKRAENWGRALRLGQRMTGGTLQPLLTTSLRSAAGRLILSLPAPLATLGGEVVTRRLDALASGLGLKAKVEIRRHPAA